VQALLAHSISFSTEHPADFFAQFAAVPAVFVLRGADASAEPYVSKTTNREGDDPKELRRIVFGQDYSGLWRASLVFMNFCGNVNYHSGRWHLYPAAPLARRVMRVGRLLAKAGLGNHAKPERVTIEIRPARKSVAPYRQTFVWNPDVT